MSCFHEPCLRTELCLDSNRLTRLGGRPAVKCTLVTLAMMAGSVVPAPPAVAAVVTPMPLLSIPLSHRLGVTSLAWSQDGRHLVSASADNTAKVWDVKQGALLRTFSDASGPVRGLGNGLNGAVSLGAGALIVTAGSDGARVWSVDTGSIHAVLEPPTHLVRGLGADAAGRLIATGGAGAVATGARAFVHVHEQGQETRSLPTHDVADVKALDLSADGRHVAMGGSLIVNETPGGVHAVGLLRVWDTLTGRIVLEDHDLPHEVSWVRLGHDRLVSYVTPSSVRLRWLGDDRRLDVAGYEAALSADGSLLATNPGQGSTTQDASAHIAAEVRELPSGRLLARVPWAHADAEAVVTRVNALAFSPDKTQLAIGFNDGKIAVWSLAEQRYIRVWFPRPFGPRQLLLTDKLGVQVLLPSRKGLALWNLERGQRTFLRAETEPDVLAMSPSGRLVAAGGQGGGTIVWDAWTGRELWNESVSLGAVQALAFSHSDQWLAVANHSDVRLWSSRDGQLHKTVASGLPSVSVVAFSPDDRRLAIGDELGEIRVISLRSGAIEITIPAPAVNATVAGLVFDAGGQGIVAAYGNGVNRVLAHDLRSGAARELGRHAAALDSVTLSAERGWVATGGEDQTVRLWRLDGAPAATAVIPHSGEVFGLAFADAGRRLLTYADSQLLIWDVQDPGSPRELLRLAELPDGAWAAMDREGRFEVGDLRTAANLFWLMSDAPRDALPLEIFMRDFFQPRLVARRLACETAERNGPGPCQAAFPLVGNPSSLSRLRPRVRITHVSQGDAPGTVNVEVEVAGVGDPGAPTGRAWTDAYDLRLLRNGHVVAWAPPLSAITRDGPTWQQTARVSPARSLAAATHTFQVRLPVAADQTEPVAFTAFAYNGDRVKSEEALVETHVPADLPHRPRTAYVLTIGVNGYAAPSRKLSFAVRDARAMKGSLSRIDGFAIVAVELTSEIDPSRWRATKSNIEEAVRRLAGKPPDPRLLAGVAGAAALRAATPDDLVVITFSGHGHTEPDGSFYLLPSDSGRAVAPDPGGRLPEAVLAQFISSNELEQWLRDIDAGQMALIIDACHSAASVARPGFKPGPMGDRGLGQLAYDKGMLILAASQSDDVALESNDLRQGLLTYALREGFAQHGRGRLADLDRDGTMTLDEWLAYGARRTPGLYEDLRSGRLKARLVGRDTRVLSSGSVQVTAARAQTPELFNFSLSPLAEAVLRDDNPRASNGLPPKKPR